MPLWFVFLDGSVYIRTLRSSAKAKHVMDDPRVSFLVETGQAWAELKAVVLHGNAELVEAPEVTSRIDQALAEKYAAFLMPTNTPSRTREHYAADRVYIRITADAPDPDMGQLEDPARLTWPRNLTDASRKASGR